MTIMRHCNILLILLFFKSVRLTQFTALVTKTSTADYACEYQDSQILTVTFPPDTSQDIFQSDLKLTINLAQGTRIVSQNIKVLWNGLQVALTSLSSSDATIATGVNLISGTYSYQMVLWSDKSIINPLAIGGNSIRLTFLPATTSVDIVYGVLQVNYSQRVVIGEQYTQPSIASHEATLFVNFKLSCVYFPAQVDLRIATTQSESSFKAVKDAGCYILVNGDIRGDDGCDSKNQQSFNLYKNNLNITASEMALQAFEVRIPRFITHRNKGGLCDWNLDLMLGSNIFCSIPICLTNLMSAEWQSFGVVPASLPIIKVSNNFSINFQPTTNIKNTDFLNVVVPMELTNINPDLFLPSNLVLNSISSPQVTIVSSTVAKVQLPEIQAGTSSSLVFLSINGTTSPLMTSAGITLTAFNFNSQELLSSTSQKLVFSPLPIKIDLITRPLAHQKGSSFDMQLTLTFDSLPTSQYTVLQLVVSPELNLLFSVISKVFGLVGSIASRTPQKNVFEIYSQNNSDKKLIMDQKVSFELLNVEIPRAEVFGSSLEVKLLQSDGVIGFQGSAAKFVNITGGSVLSIVSSDSHIISPTPAKPLGKLLVSTMVSSLTNNENSLQIELIITSKSSRQSLLLEGACRATQNGVVISDCSVRKLNDRAFLITTLISIPQNTEATLQFTANLDSDLIPSSIVALTTAKNTAGSVVSQSNETIIQLGCESSCNLCFVADLSLCSTCNDNFYLRNNSCVEVIQPPSFQSILAKDYIVEQSSTRGIIIMAIGFALFFHLFVTRRYKGTISSHIVDKVIMSSVTMLAQVLIYIQLESGTAFSLVLGSNFSIGFLMNCIGLTVYLMLSKQYPFMKLSGRTIMKNSINYLFCIFVGYQSLMWMIKDRTVLEKLKDQNLISQGKKFCKQPPNIKVEHVCSELDHPAKSIDKEADSDLNKRYFKKRVSKSMEDIDVGPFDNKQKASFIIKVDKKEEAVKDEELSRSVKSTADTSTPTQRSKRPEDFTLIDFYNQIKRINIIHKFIILILYILASIFFINNVLKWNFELFGVIILEIFAYLSVPVDAVEHFEPVLTQSQIDNLHNSSIVAEAIASFEDPNKQHDPSVSGQESLTKPKSEPFTWADILDSLILKAKHLPSCDDIENISTDSIQEETNQRLKEFLEERQLLRQMAARGQDPAVPSLRRSNSLGNKFELKNKDVLSLGGDLKQEQKESEKCREEMMKRVEKFYSNCHVADRAVGEVQPARQNNQAEPRKLNEKQGDQLSDNGTNSNKSSGDASSGKRKGYFDPLLFSIQGMERSGLVARFMSGRVYQDDSIDGQSEEQNQPEVEMKEWDREEKEEQSYEGEWQ